MHIYIIGGSPCSGKSTVAEALAVQYNLTYFKVDDYLDEFTARGAAEGLPICQRIQRMSPDETWMRPPHIQCQEELDYYAEIAPYVMEKLCQLARPVVAEGAAFLPGLFQSDGYIAIVPSAEFQISRYRERPWVPHVLQGCTDKEKAFSNWMERDILFAQAVRERCLHLHLPCLITDGSVSPEERLKQLAAHFHLDGQVCQERT